jgi:hypothetical protein
MTNGINSKILWQKPLLAHHTGVPDPFPSHLLRALRWKTLMEPMGYHPSLPNTFFAVMIGYLANLAVPRLGEVLKCTILAKYEKVPAEKSGRHHCCRTRL